MNYFFDDRKKKESSPEKICADILHGRQLAFSRVTIIGAPGSGKSFLSYALEALIAVPIIHLDTLFWNADGSHISHEELRGKIEGIVTQNQWFIDGNYTDSIELRLKYAQLVIFLDLPSEECVSGLRMRANSPRKEMPCVIDELEPGFVEYVRNFRTSTRNQIIKLLKQNPAANILHLYTREEVNLFIRIVKAHISPHISE